MEEPIALPPSIEDVPPPGLALVEELDKLLLVQVRPESVEPADRLMCCKIADVFQLACHGLFFHCRTPAVA